MCERDKPRFYLTMLALSNDVRTLYLSRNLTEELFNFEGEDFIKV
ncbi:MAG: hypothetical protein ACP5HQ_04200 [Thermoprotei archaeon]